MKKLLSVLAVIVITGAIAYGANLSLITGPQDPSQLNATLNTTIRTINTSLGILPGSQQMISVGNTPTVTETTFSTYTMPANLMGASGNVVHVVCWGRAASNANVKVVRIYFGGAAITSNVVQGFGVTSTNWSGQFNVIRTGASLSNTWGVINIDPTGSTVNSSVNIATTAFTGALVAKCTGQSATAAADLTGDGMYVSIDR